MKNTLRNKLGASLLALATGLALLPATPVQAAGPLDGKSSETAAASCYEIKKNNPSSTSGVYWLYTPQMNAPEQFYCDQVTDGGGWVLIGRGREGWTEEYAGKGSSEALAKTPDGTGAFSPVQLPSETINALLNGQAPSNLSDGVRFRRALNTSGSQWQEVRASRTRASEWTWALGAHATWSNVRFSNNGAAFTRPQNTKGGIAEFDSSSRAIKFTGRDSQDFKIGFSYGHMTTGSNSDSSYLWSKSGGYALPFTQVYLRPTVLSNQLSFPAISDQGAAGSSRMALPNSYSAPVRWRTSEQTATGATGEMNTYVQAIAQVGDTVFVGGDYAYVESATGERVNQPYLSGYNVHTGELVRTFKPTFNNQIKSLEALPNGLLAVGGEFTQANGEDSPGLVLLDPVSGKTDKRWTWALENRVAGSTISVKSMDVQGDFLYIAGSFTHVRGDATPNPTYARNMARYNVNTGAVDWTWRPVFNGTVNGVSASADGKTVYAAGYFGVLNDVAVKRLAALNTSDAQVRGNWNWAYSYPDPRVIGGFQFDVEDAGSSVYAAGAEHLVARYDSTSFARKSSAITISGGDFQDLHAAGSVIYAACHCGDWIYEGSDQYENPWDQNTDIQQIRLVAAMDRATGAVIPDFNPQIKGASGNGVWESFVDSTGTLWVGGDINSSLGASGNQKTVGFVRFAPRDVEAPAVPTGLQVKTENGKDKLTWNAVGEARYQVLRDNRVLATVSQPSYEVDHTDNARYFVRTIDGAGNFSASTAVVRSGVAAPAPSPTASASASPTATPTVAPTAQPTASPSATATEEPSPVAPKPDTEKLFESGADWNMILPGLFTPGNWKAEYTEITRWNAAKTSLGWGNAPVTTRVNYGWFRPMSMYLRKNVTLTNINGIEKLTLTTYADDGLVLYVNGKEVSRHNMPSGTIRYNTPALSLKETTESRKDPIVIEVPTSMLKEGNNVIAVEVHAAISNSANVSFDMTADVTR